MLAHFKQNTPGLHNQRQKLITQALNLTSFFAESTTKHPQFPSQEATNPKPNCPRSPTLPKGAIPPQSRYLLDECDDDDKELP